MSNKNYLASCTNTEKSVFCGYIFVIFHKSTENSVSWEPENKKYIDFHVGQNIANQKWHNLAPRCASH